jgi:hypothetical protein
MLKIARASGLIAFQHQRSGLGWPGTSKSIYCACHTFCRRFGHDARALTADNDSCVCKRTVYTPFWRLPRDLRQFSDPTEWWKRHENKISLTFWVTGSQRFHSQSAEDSEDADQSASLEIVCLTSL